jgi:rhamnose transport system ATP-binding protein
MSPDAKVAQLSMPEQQLVEIACAVAAGARIVIMDEPTASLTQRETDLLLRTVRDLRSRGVGVIYISHRLEEIFAIADRVTVLRDGESVCTRSLQPSPESSPVTRSELIRSMVGRELSQVYPPPSGPPGDILLSLENFGCSEAGVHGVTLEIHAGEVVGLAGLVGAGRTELARALFGISPADSGTVRLSGQLVHIDSPRSAIDQGIAYVPEDRRRHGIILDLPISSNMTLAVHQRIFPGGWLRFGAENGLTLDYIRRLSIRTSGANARGGSLSGGNQQKVSLARWLATRPRLLILDEPTQGVDVGAKAEIHRIIRQLAADGMAVLMISSDLPEIVGMSQRIAVMRGGTVVGILPGGSDAHQVIELALGQKPGAAAA